MRLVFWYPLRWLVICVPLSWGVRILSALGVVHCVMARGKKAMLQQHLHTMGIEDAAAVQQYFINHYVDQLFILLAPKLRPDNVDRWVEFEGLSYLDEGLKHKKGVVLIHGHFGPAHMPLVCLAHKGYSMKQVGHPSDEGLSWIGRNVAFRLRMKYEGKMPVAILEATAFMRPVFEALKNNSVVMMTGDGSGREELIGRHHEVSFLGHRVLFPLGPSTLSHKTGAPLIPMFVQPGTKKLFRVLIEPSLYDPAVDPTFDPVMLAERFAEKYELYIRRAPGYMHFLDRFAEGAWVKGKLDADGCQRKHK